MRGKVMKSTRFWKMSNQNLQLRFFYEFLIRFRDAALQVYRKTIFSFWLIDRVHSQRVNFSFPSIKNNLDGKRRKNCSDPFNQLLVAKEKLIWLRGHGKRFLSKRSLLPIMRAHREFFFLTYESPCHSQKSMGPWVVSALKFGTIEFSLILFEIFDIFSFSKRDVDSGD